MSDFRFPFPNKQDSMVILQKDPCYKKIPKERVSEAFEDAWNVGVTEARAFLKRCCVEDFDMVRILKQLEFKIDIQDVDYVMGNIRYFCEYLSGKHTICVYKKGIELWAEKNGFEYDEAQNIILAHEYFHYLEAHSIGWVSKHCLVPMLIIGKLEIGKTGIAALSEVAANAFANEYFGAYKKC